MNQIRFPNRRLAHQVAALVLAAGFTMAVKCPSHACAFHTYMPSKTLVDQIIEAEVLVLARQAPDDPFRFTPFETIRHRVEPPPIPDLVDTATRRRLSDEPNHAVLFAYDADSDGWIRVTYVDEVMRPVVDHIVELAPRWSTGGDDERVRFAAALLGQKNQALRRLALTELDRAPYSMLRKVGVPIGAEALLNDLWRFQEIPYLPIRALLLGLTGNDAARAVIRTAVERAAHVRSSSNLGPWATALIEIDGSSGVAMLQALFLRDATQPAKARELVVEALAVHNISAEPQLRGAIGLALSDFLRRDPASAVMIARQFGSRNDWTQAERLKEALNGGAVEKGPDLDVVTSYLAQARRPRADVR
jgi:hypothetical protein